MNYVIFVDGEGPADKSSLYLWFYDSEGGKTKLQLYLHARRTHETTIQAGEGLTITQVKWSDNTRG